MKKLKMFNWFLAITLLAQLFVSSTASLVTFAEGSGNVVSDLLITDTNGNSLTTTSLNKGDSLTVGVQSENAADQSLSIYMAGMELDQEATNALNTNNEVTVMYSAAASNVLVNWQVATAATDESNVDGIEPLIPAAPVKKQVFLVMKASEAGSHVLSAKSNRNGTDIYATPLQINVADKAAEAEAESTEEQPAAESEDPDPAASTEGKAGIQAQNGIVAAAATVSGKIEMQDENGNWTNTLNLIDRDDYGNEIKYRMTVSSDKDFDVIEFQHNMNLVPYLNFTSQKVSYTPVNGGAVQDVTSQFNFGFVERVANNSTLSAGTYVYEYSMEFPINTDLSAYYDQATGKNKMQQPQSIYYESDVEYDDIKADLIIMAILPQSKMVQFVDQLTKAPIPNVTGVVVGALENGTKDYAFTADANGVVYLPVVGAGPYEVKVTTAAGYKTSTDKNYMQTVTGSTNIYNPNIQIDPAEYALEAQGTDIVITMAPQNKKIHYNDIVTISQTNTNRSGPDLKEVRFFVTAPTAKWLVYQPGTSKIVRYKDGVKVAEWPLAEADSWKSVGDPTAGDGYLLDYTQKLTEPLKNGESLALEADWLALSDNTVSYSQVYSVNGNAGGLDVNDRFATNKPDLLTLNAYAENIIKTELIKSVLKNNVNVDTKELKVGDQISYELLVQFTGNAGSQGKVKQITDQLPAGLKVDSITLDGSNVTRRYYTLTDTNHLTVDVSSFNNKVSTITNNLADSQRKLVINATVMKEASGYLNNQGNVTTETRTEDFVDNSWGNPEDTVSNEVSNFVKTEFKIVKTAFKTGSKEEVSYSYIGEVLDYQFDISLGEYAGAMYDGKISDELDAGLEVMPGTTRLVINDVEQTPLDDTKVWTGNKLEVPLDPLTSATKLSLIFSVKTKDGFEKKSIDNIVKLEGGDKDKIETTEVKNNAEVLFIFKPGEIKAEKFVEIIGRTPEKNKDQQEIAVVGDTLKYTVVVSNPAAEDTIIRNATVIDDLPVGVKLDPDSIQVNGVDVERAKVIEITDQKLTVDVGDVRGGKNAILTFEVKVLDTVEGKITNVAAATAKVDEIPGEAAKDDLKAEAPPVTNGMEIQPTITKNVTDALVFDGAEQEYTLVITNPATMPIMYNGEIKDELPAEVDYKVGSTKINSDVEDPTADKYWIDGNRKFIMDNFTLKPGETITIKYKVIVNSPTLNPSITNKASITGTTKDKTGTGAAIDTAEFGVVPGPGDPYSEKHVYNDNGEDIENKVVKVNDILTYEIETGNKSLGVSEITDTVLTDLIPDGVELVAGSVEVISNPTTVIATEVKPDITLNIPSLNKGESVTLRFKAKVVSTTALIENKVTTTGTTIKTPDGEIQTVTSHDEVENYLGPDPTFEKSIVAADPDNVKAFKNDELTYRIVVKNGTKDITGDLIAGVISDTLPNEVTYKPDTTTVNGKKVADTATMWSGQNFNYNLAEPLKGGETVTVEFTVKVVTGDIKTGIVNNATLDGTDKEGVTRYPKADTAEFETVRAPGTLKPSKFVKSEDGATDLMDKVIQDGQIIRYEIVVTNTTTDPSEVRDVIVKDTLVAGLVYRTGSLAINDIPVVGDDLAFIGQELELNIGALTETQSKTVSFLVEVTDPTLAIFANTGKAEGSVALNPNKPTELTPLLPKDTNTVVNKKAPNPTIKKTIVDAPETPNKKTMKDDVFTYQLVVKNGVADTTGDLVAGVVTDKLPAEVEYVAGTTKVGGVKVDDIGIWSGQDLTYNIPTTMVGGAELKITFDVKVITTDIKAGILNTAHINGTDYDGVNKYTNKSEVAFDIVLVPGTLEIGKSVKTSDGVTDLNDKLVKEQDEILYEIVVTNTTTNPSEIRDVIVTDPIPAGLLYVAGSLMVTGATNPEAYSDANVVGQDLKVNVGTLKENQSVTISFKVTVTEDTEKISSNIAEVGGTVTTNPRESTEEEKLTPPPTTPVVVEQVPTPTIEKNIVGADPITGIQVAKDGTLTYELVVTNGKANYTGDLFKAVVTDSLPSEVEYIPETTKIDGVQVADAGIWSGQQLTYTLPDTLIGGEKLTITFEVKVVTTDFDIQVPNTAKVTGEDKEGKAYDDESTTEFDVIRTPGTLVPSKKVLDLSDKDIEDQTVQRNNVIRYEIVVQNTELNPSEITSIVVKDTLQAGLVYQAGTLKVNGTPVSDSFVKGQELEVPLTDSLLEGQKATISFDVLVTDATDTPIVNGANVTGKTTVAPTAPVIDLEAKTNDVIVHLPPVPTVVKSVDKTAANAEDELTYELVVSNGAKGGLLQGSILTDTLPANVEYVAGSTKLDGVAVADSEAWPTNTSLAIKIPDLNAGESAKVSFKVKVLVPAINTTILNTAALGNMTDVPEVPSNEVATPIYPTPGKIIATKDVTDAAGNSLANKLASEGEQVTYTIVVENVSAAHELVEDVVVNDAIPTELSYVAGSLQVNGASLPDSYVVGNQLTVPVGTLAGGEKATITFGVTIGKTDALEITNTAEITANAADGKGGKTSLPPLYPDVTFELEKPSVTIVKARDQERVKAGETITYELVVTNTATKVNWTGTVQDTLPTNTEYVAGSTIVDGVVIDDAKTWNGTQLAIDVIDLAPSKSKVIKFTVRVMAGVVNTTITNTANLVSEDNTQNLVSNTVETAVYADPSDPASVLPNTAGKNPSNPADPADPPKTLPQTGDAKQNLANLGALVVLGSISLFYFMKKKKEQLA